MTDHLDPHRLVRLRGCHPELKTRVTALVDVLARAWPNCKYLLWFSDSRAGGTRDYEAEVRPWHTAIADAITRNV